MDENGIEGAVKTGAGRIQGAAGALTGDTRLEARGKLNEAAGSAQQFYGRAVDQVKSAAGNAGDLISDQPLAAVAVATVAGLALGLLIGTAL
ncbi:MAG TPA: CsbD family protein [Caulobacteraceae bacterium]